MPISMELPPALRREKDPDMVVALGVAEFISIGSVRLVSGQSIRREKRAAQNFRTFTVDVKKTLHNGCTKGVCARVGAAAKI